MVYFLEIQLFLTRQLREKNGMWETNEIYDSLVKRREEKKKRELSKVPPYYIPFKLQVNEGTPESFSRS